MAEKRYLVRPGRVMSKNDGDIHYIGARQLMHLHGVDPRECIVIPGGEEWPPGFGHLATEEQRQAAGLTLLEPMYHGNYGVPSGFPDSEVSTSEEEL